MRSNDLIHLFQAGVKQIIYPVTMRVYDLIQRVYLIHPKKTPKKPVFMRVYDLFHPIYLIQGWKPQCLCGFGFDSVLHIPKGIYI